MQEDLEVTGISRSGRVRKKSSKLMDFESPDDIDTRFRRQTPVKSFTGFRQEETHDFHEAAVPRPSEEAGTASGSESDYYENNGDNVESNSAPHSMESDSSASDEGAARTPAHSLYMMEKSTKKKLIVKDGRVVGRAKAQRKDKGKTRITAYMMWAKEARNELLRKHPEMDFSAISKRLGEMWSNVTYNERHQWKRKAKRFAMQREQTNQPPANRIISNNTPRHTPGQVGRPPKQQPSPSTPPHQALPPASAPSSAAAGSGSGGSGGAARAGAGAAACAGGAAAGAGGVGAVELAAHLRLLGESLAIIGERLKEHEGQIAVSGSVSVLLDTLLCSLAPLLGVSRAIPAIAPPARLLQDTLHNIAYIMPGL